MSSLLLHLVFKIEASGVGSTFGTTTLQNSNWRTVEFVQVALMFEIEYWGDTPLPRLAKRRAAENGTADILRGQLQKVRKPRDLSRNH